MRFQSRNWHDVVAACLYTRAKKREQSKMSEVPERIIVSLTEKEWKLRTFGKGENSSVMNIDSEVLRN